MTLRRTPRGVTLVELLVVLVITSIALSLVLPSVGNSYEAWQLRSTGRQLASMLRFASQVARREGVSLACYYRDHQLVLVRNGAVVKRVNVPASVTVAPAAPHGAVFLPTGQMLASEEFTLTNQRGRTMAVRTGPLYGQVSIVEGTQ